MVCVVAITTQTPIMQTNYNTIINTPTSTISNNKFGIKLYINTLQSNQWFICRNADSFASHDNMWEERRPMFCTCEVLLNLCCA